MLCLHCCATNVAAARFCSYCGHRLGQRQPNDAELRVDAREQLAHASRLTILGEMVAGLAHELNQPLTALRMYASAAEELCSMLDLPELRDCVKRIDEQSLRTGEIIRRMRNFAKRGPSRHEAIDLNRLIREVTAILEYEIRRAQVRLELNLAVNLQSVWGDPVQIQQVLVNLLRNAMDAMTQTAIDQRVLSVHSAMDGNYASVRITDTGCGVEPSLAASLFKPFQSTNPTGLGLGLTICRTLVEAHGGSIGMEPRLPRGTTFFLSLSTISDQGTA